MTDNQANERAAPIAETMRQTAEQLPANGPPPPLPLPEDPLIGYRLANFVIEGVHRRAGMSQVYYGLDIMLQRRVAIKVTELRLLPAATKTAFSGFPMMAR